MPDNAHDPGPIPPARSAPRDLPTTPIWHQQPGESSLAYRAFITFRDLGPRRSVQDATRALRDRAIADPAPTNRRLPGKMTPWVKPWRWVERAHAWDAHLQADRDVVQAAYAALWERRRIEALEETWTVAQSLLDKAKKMLEMPIVDRTTDDGRTTIKAARWTFQTASEMTRLAVEMKQRASETATPPAGECEDVELAAIVRAAHEAKGAIPSVKAERVEPDGRDDEVAEADGA